MSGKLSDNPAGKNSAPKNTDTFVGFTVLAVMVVFASLWMYGQGRNKSASEATPIIQNIAIPVVPGFRADLWNLPDDSSLGFVEIPAGVFLMGSNPALDRFAFENERWSDTQRQGALELPAYFIARFEVTQAQYAAFAKDTGSSMDGSALQSQADHPVVNISWTDALAYARWLDSRLRDSPETPELLRNLLQSDNGWRVTLPTEAEWEKAARGQDGKLYPWGNRAQPEQANFNSAGTRPVGSSACPDCQYGLADMSGNVWELTRSPLQPYPYDPNDDASKLAADALWVMRGGSFNDSESGVRTAIRGGVDPGVRNATIGFRLVISRL